MASKFLLKKWLNKKVCFSAVFSFLIPFASFGEEPTTEISQGVAGVYADTPGSEMAKKMQIQIRALIESIISKDKNRSVYLQGVEPPGENAAIDPLLNMVVEHFERYCSPAGEGGMSTECKVDLMLQDGDLKPSSILGIPKLDEETLPAATRFLANLVDPIPNGKFQGGATQDPKTGKSVPITIQRIQKEPDLRKDLADALVGQTVLNVARNSLAEAIAKRSPLKDNSGADISDQTFMEMMQQQACQRFYNQDWQKNMKEAYLKAMKICEPETPECKAEMEGQKPEPEKAVLFENAIMDAVRTCLDYERYLQMERVEVLLGAQLVQNYRANQAASAFVNKK